MRHIPAIVAILAAVLLAPPPARAGSYVVRACGSDGVNGSWWGSASPGLTAYTSCPGLDFDGINTGIVARSVQNGNGGSVPAFSGAWERFDAPSGASLSSITFSASGGRPSGCWAFGLYPMWSNDFSQGWHAWGYDADCNVSGGGWSYFAGPYAIDLRGAGHLWMGVACVRPAGCPTNSGIAWANLKDVAVTVVDNTAPGVSPTIGGLWGDGWLRGTQEARADLGDNVGIRHLVGAVDGGPAFWDQDFAAPGWPYWVRCDYARSRPCFDIAGGAVSLDTARLPDGAHTLHVGAVDAAGNEGHVDHTIRVDNHAPAPPGDVGVAGGEGWRRANGFDVAWTNPPGQAAPISRARWSLCRADRPAECSTGSRDAPDVHGLDGLLVPGTGEYTLAVWLEDEAGNADAALASGPVRLRLDELPPTSPGFDPADPADPRRLSLPVADQGSGVAAATIQLRRRPEGEWRSLPTALAGGRAWTQVPDTELPDGPYDVRAVLRDGAGNEATIAGDAFGRPRAVVLPLRTPTRLTVPDRLRLAFGRRGRLAGALATYQTRPVAGATIAVLERIASERDFRRAATVRTDGAGRLAYAVPPGPSRTVRFAFGGDDLLLPASRDVHVLVPAAVSLRANRALVRNGRIVFFRGRLLGRPWPGAGRTVDLQAHYRGAWRTFATPRADRQGRFLQAYRFGATVGRVVYRFRALAKRDAAYPYEAGASPTVRVTVVG